ncbi:MAG: 30S ribosomal protein S5 [Candidatus Micrarchaeia archaeon]|jgi:small subunit ribosomal protein S5
MARPFRDNSRREEENRQARIQAWVPRTELGRKVQAGEIASIDQILDSGKRILESEIIDTLLPDLKEELLEVRSTQRMTASGRKQRMEAIVALGNKRGYIAVGIGKAPETRDAIAEAIADAKRRIVRVPLGCGSWECGCGTAHSLSQEVSGSNSSTKITIRPAPRGVGLVAGETAKKVLTLVGVKDAWTFTKGRTRNILNMVLATIDALDSLNSMKKGTIQDAEEPALPVEAPAQAEGETAAE